MKKSDATSLRIGSLNARGIRGHEKEIVNFFYSEKLDILCLQEVMITADSNYNFSRIKLPGAIFFSDTPHHSLAVYFREGLHVDLFYAVKGVCFFAKVRPPGEEILVANCYLSPNRPEAAELLSRALRSYAHEGPIIVCGDLNARFAGHCSKVTNRNGKLVHKLCEEFSLQRTEAAGPTTVKGTAVDHFLVSHNIQSQAQVIDTNVASSDHLPIVLSTQAFCFGKAAPQARHWKRGLLPKRMGEMSRKISERLSQIEIPANASCQEALSNIYQEFLDTSHSILSSHLGLHKSTHQKPISGDILQVMKERDHIFRMLRVKHSKVLEEALEKTQRMLNAAKKREAFRGFRDWKSQLSASTNSEQARTLSKVFGSRTPRFAPPASAVGEFFENLMGKRKVTRAPQEINKDPASVQEVTEEEVLGCLGTMSSEKAQGQDDIPAWFLKEFKCELSKWLAKYFTLSLRSGIVPQQWQKGRAIFLPKDGSMHPSKFRPITILSRVRILFEKVLLARLQGPLKTNQFQGGFKKAHRCQHWAGVLHDVISTKDLRKEELLVASVDCEKAFDTVSFQALLEKLKNSPYLAVVSNLVCSQRIRMHGTNKWFYPERGTPQGGALSPALFNAAVENMHSELQNLPKIKVNSLEINHLQWADDLVLLAENEHDLTSLLQSARENLGRSGLKLNESKSKILAINSSITTIGDIHVAESLKYLGVYFNSKGIDCKKDFEVRKNNLLRAAGMFKGIGFHRGGLTASTRILIAKTFLIPRVTYALPLYPPGSLSRSKMRAVDRLVINLTFGQRTPLEVGHVLLNSPPLEFLAQKWRQKLVHPRDLSDIETITCHNKEHIKFTKKRPSIPPQGPSESKGQKLVKRSGLQKTVQKSLDKDKKNNLLTKSNLSAFQAVSTPSEPVLGENSGRISRSGRKSSFELRKKEVKAQNAGSTKLQLFPPSEDSSLRYGQRKKMGLDQAKGENRPKIVQELQKAVKTGKRKRFTPYSPAKFVFLGKKQDLKHEWSPRTKLGVECFQLMKTGRKAFNKLTNAEQGLLVAFLANRFPGGGKICRKCDTGERVTRGHLKRCFYSKEYFKKVRYKNFEKHTVSYFRLFGRIKKMIWEF